MDLPNRIGNVYMIDTMMRGFPKYHSIYLVKGDKLALIDTGEPNHIEFVRKGIKEHGFSISDISYIFVTHEHTEHLGNTAPFLRESPNAKVYIHPLGKHRLLDPNSPSRALAVSAAILARKEIIEPVPESRIQELKDGEVFDLGNGEKLRIIFAPGHQPGEIVIYQEKDKGLFINDLVGNCFTDAGAHYPLNPLGSDNQVAIESLKKLKELPLAYLFMGHFGISDKPTEIINKTIDNMQKLLAIGRKYISEGKPELIADEVYNMILPELEKLKPVRGEVLYQYATHDHIPFQAKLFAQYCQQKLR
jgi:glyoxylase-like metal-dependent hydrolase (beta-lactamase superfamily II)